MKVKQKMSKKSEKNYKNQHFIAFFVLVLFFFLTSCTGIRQNCKISPDLERIGESAIENKENLTETELRSAKINCNY